MWHKSSFSTANSECVEVAHQPEEIGVRDSKNPAGPVLTVGPVAWSALLEKIN